jgi:uncharacterized protein (UPF0333 family)
MPPSSPRGQALPEYLLLLLALLIVATVGLKAVRASFNAVEEDQAFYFSLPSP